MRSTFKRVMALAGIAACAAVWAGAASAEYPDRPITLLVPSNPGGGMDATARVIVPFLEKALGGTIVIENNPQGGGVVAMTEVARAEPDGYTIGLGNVGFIVSAAVTTPGHFKADDFSYIGSITSDPVALIVKADSPIQSLDDLVAQLKDGNSITTIGTPPVRSLQSIAMTQFGDIVGAKVTKIPLSNGGAAINAVLGGHVTAVCLSLGGALRVGDKVRVLAQAGEERDGRAPDVPTFKELGYDMTLSVFRNIVAPAGLPDDVEKKLEDAFNAAVSDEGLKAEAAKQKLDLMPLDGAALSDLAKTTQARLARLWKKSPWFEAN